MKTIIVVVLGLFLAFNTNAQRVICDTLFFPDYERDLKDMLLYKPEVVQKELVLYKTAAVIAGTFLINEAIIRHSENTGNYKNTTRITGSVFLIGITTSVVVFSKELKSYERKK